MAQVVVSAEVPLKFEDAVRVATDDGGAMLGVAAKDAEAVAEDLVAAEPALAGFVVGRDPQVEATAPQVTWNAAAGIDVRFTGVAPASLFGSTRGVIELSGMAGGTAISFIGSYRPHGEAGIMADEAAGLQVARVALQRFVDRFAQLVGSAA